MSAAELLDLAATPGEVTEDGLRANVSIGFQYISFWLGGRGAAAINSLMEDAATAEISRTQIWQWVHHGVELPDGRPITAELVRRDPRRGDGEDPRAPWARRPGRPGVRRRPGGSSSTWRCPSR